jgi:ankyrin repeat protein
MTDATAFVQAATGGRRPRAEARLAARPEIAEDPWAALVLGRGWDGDVHAPGGPNGWAPLLYAAHSCFAPAGLLADLLARGADPNAAYVNEYGPQSALYGAAGVVFDPEMTRLLLEAGADPDDGESVYHAATAPDPTCLRLLLEHGADPRETNALGSGLDEERPEHLRLLLEHGADVAEGAVVAHAVRRGRSPEIIRLLAAHGADVDRPGGETWRGDVPLRTPYQQAVLRAREDQMAALADLGARTGVDPADAALGRLARGEPLAEPLPASLDPDAQECLVLAALRGHVDAVLDAAPGGPAFVGVVAGSPAGTLLHHAAWVGNAAVARRLLERGADPDGRAPGAAGRPLGWAAAASTGGPGAGDHVGVAEALVAAGALIDPADAEQAEGPLRDWLQGRIGPV